MKLRILSLTLLCLVLAAIPADGQTLYDNGPINGTTDAWTINFGYIVSDSFTVASGSTITGFVFGVWEFPTDTMISLQWSITSGENSGTVYGSGVAKRTLGGPPNGGSGMLTDTFISSNQYGYNLDMVTVTGIDPALGSGGAPGGTTYWLNLQNAVVGGGDPAYWDENGGVGCGGSDGKGANCPSMASQNTVGTIASESFTILGSSGTGTTPEPSSIMLFGSGFLGLVGVLRRKLF